MVLGPNFSCRALAAVVFPLPEFPRSTMSLGIGRLLVFRFSEQPLGQAHVLRGTLSQANTGSRSWGRAASGRSKSPAKKASRPTIWGPV